MNTNKSVVDNANPKYLIVNPSSYSTLRNVEINKAVNISEITTVIALIVTKKNFCEYEPSKHNAAIKDHNMTVIKMLGANDKCKFVLAKFIVTAI